MLDHVDESVHDQSSGLIPGKMVLMGTISVPPKGGKELNGKLQLMTMSMVTV